MKKLVTAARTSADWYEHFPEHMKLDLMDFAYSYITRSGRIDDARLRAMSPAFMARYEASKDREPCMTHDIADQVPPDNPGAREIGFAIPESYNASRILFDNLAHGRGERLALTGPGGTRTYARALRRGLTMGPRLSSRSGLKRGDRILMFLDDTPAYPAAFFGAVRSGFVPLLINTLTPPDLLQFYLSDAGAAVAVAEAEFCVAVQRGGLQGHAAAHPDRGQRRRGRTRRAEARIAAEHMAAGVPHRSAGSRHPPRRDGVLDVFVRLDRTPQGHRASAARHGL